MDFDRVLEKCGNFGRYQYVLMLLFGYTNILSSMHYFSQTIIGFTPEHWCYHEKLDNLTFHEIHDVYADTSHSSCTLLEDVANGTAIIADERGQCREWIFQYESNYESVTTELNWVCDDAYKLAVGQSLFFVGSVVGTISFGIIADKFGRLPALVLTTLTGATGDFLTAFVSSLPAFAFCRFISGFSMDTLLVLMYIMVFEYLSPQKRTFGLNIIIAIFYCMGLMFSPWFAIWVGTWRKYLMVASIPAVAVLIYPMIICESAQWLMTKGKYDKAVRCLKYVAKFNKRQVEENVFIDFVKYCEHKAAEEKKLNNKSDTFMGMLRTPRLRKFTIILILKSIITTLAYDILSRNMEGLGSSPFLLFCLTSFVYVPSGISIILLQNRIGRKGMACGGLFFGGIITLITGFIIAFLDRKEHALLLGIMVGLSRYGATLAYDADAQYSTEIIPSSVRAQGVANVHVVGFASSFLSAYVIFLGNFYKPLPAIFMSILMLIGAVLCLALPETFDKKLPDTLSEGELFGLDEKWYYFTCFRKPNKRTEENSCENNN